MQDAHLNDDRPRFTVGHYSRGHYGDHYAIRDSVEGDTFGEWPWSNAGRDEAQKVADRLNGLGK